MSQRRLFVSQETLDRWLSDERADVEGDLLTLRPEGTQFRLTSAVHFLKEVADGGDVGRLVGKVKDLARVGDLGGDHCQGSVVIGDDAYEVVDGFLGEPVAEAAVDLADGHSLAAAAAAVTGGARPDADDPASLGRLFGKGR